MARLDGDGAGSVPIRKEARDPAGALSPHCLRHV
jgi:hypothetical protein